MRDNYKKQTLHNKKKLKKLRKLQRRITRKSLKHNQRFIALSNKDGKSKAANTAINDKLHSRGETVKDTSFKFKFVSPGISIQILT